MLYGIKNGVMPINSKTEIKKKTETDMDHLILF